MVSPPSGFVASPVSIVFRSVAEANWAEGRPKSYKKSSLQVEFGFTSVARIVAPAGTSLSYEVGD